MLKTPAEAQLRQKVVRTLRDEQGNIVRNTSGYPILTEVYIDKGPRMTSSSIDQQMKHTWARKQHYESAPPPDADDSLASSWPTPVPNKRRKSAA